MKKDKCCGNCKYFKDEDVEGWGYCSFNKTKTHCAQCWDCHNSTFNGWTEITPDNVDEVYEKRGRIAFMNPTRWEYMTVWHNAERKVLELYALRGGYYYYVLPELRIE
jgi:hypothetical protein